GHAPVGHEAPLRGPGELGANPGRLAADLDATREVLAEAGQTAMRRHGPPGPYEQLEAPTRRQGIKAATMRELSPSHDLTAPARERLLARPPGDYTGLAAELASGI